MDTPQKKWIETGKALFSLCKAEKTARLHDQQKAYGWERYIDEIFRLDPYKDYIGMQTKLYGLDATIGTRVMKKEISHAELTRIAGCMHQKQNTCGAFTSLIDRIILLAQNASARMWREDMAARNGRRLNIRSMAAESIRQYMHEEPVGKSILQALCTAESGVMLTEKEIISHVKSDTGWTITPEHIHDLHNTMMWIYKHMPEPPPVSAIYDKKIDAHYFALQGSGEKFIRNALKQTGDIAPMAEIRPLPTAPAPGHQAKIYYPAAFRR